MLFCDRVLIIFDEAGLRTYKKHEVIAKRLFIASSFFV